MKKDLAEETVLFGIAMSGAFNTHLKKNQKECPPEESKLYVRRFGQVMGRILTEIEMPIFEEYPDLKPDYLGGPYKLGGNRLEITWSKNADGSFNVEIGD